jgi:hypothetical protein
MNLLFDININFIFLDLYYVFYNIICEFIIIIVLKLVLT